MYFIEKTMIRHKVIAIHTEIVDILKLIDLIHERRDKKETTGVLFKIDLSNWRLEPDGYGGHYERTGERYIQQEKVKLNREHNDRRLQALEKLEMIGGAIVIRFLLKPIITPRYEKTEDGEITVLDDLSFETEIEKRRVAVVNKLLEAESPQLYSDIFKDISSDEAHEICRILNIDYKEAYLRIIKSLSENNPTQLIRLANLLM